MSSNFEEIKERNNLGEITDVDLLVRRIGLSSALLLLETQVEDNVENIRKIEREIMLLRDFIASIEDLDS